MMGEYGDWSLAETVAGLGIVKDDEDFSLTSYSDLEQRNGGKQITCLVIIKTRVFL